MKKNGKSRRRFMKVSGGLALSALPLLQIPSHRSTDHVKLGQPDIGKILSIIEKSIVISEIKQLVESAGFIFALDSEKLQVITLPNPYLGIHLNQLPSEKNNRIGLELAFLVDTKLMSLVSAQVLKVWCLPMSTEIESTIYDLALSKIVMTTVSKDGTPDPPVELTPRQRDNWSFSNLDAIPLQPEELVDVGWPPELADVPRWHYGSLDQPKLNDSKSARILMFESVTITYQSTTENKTKSLSLTYPQVI